jgi:hypothetical protein
MANALYEKAKNSFLTGGIAWTSASIGVVLCASPYTPNLVTDNALDDIAAANRVASAILTATAASDGQADAEDVTFATLSGSVVKSIVVFEYTGTESTSELIAYFDSASGLPLTPNGGDVTIAWDSGSNRIFHL